jgi:hypothetical protein
MSIAWELYLFIINHSKNSWKMVFFRVYIHCASFRALYSTFSDLFHTMKTLNDKDYFFLAMSIYLTNDFRSLFFTFTEINMICEGHCLIQQNRIEKIPTRKWSVINKTYSKWFSDHSPIYWRHYISECKGNIYPRTFYFLLHHN